MTKWLLVAAVVLSTVISDLLQSSEMKRHGAIDEFRPGRWGRIMAGALRRGRLILSIVFMALSFFAFLTLLRIADLSFAVPATAASYVVETVLARYLLKEHLDWRRWSGAGLVACGVAMLSF
jgi:drug/metabolite transporter (DMT)-like permease